MTILKDDPLKSFLLQWPLSQSAHLHFPELGGQFHVDVQFLVPIFFFFFFSPDFNMFKTKVSPTTLIDLSS